ncbi:hypothetical protein BDV25DRAFT_161482 [Aspergillus avenaceus]|uniref:Nucleic acid-binding protein n=1 Tax=Aspergillus avenaceus TaxID=36643 RepID=A0A5N6TLG4_ASPAV|nr:hypothetical protein BDV25DRAFT_161482 [Aspergillus avenaceus]
MPTKVIFLMGAPTSQSLRWDEEGLLTSPIFPFHSLEALAGDNGPATNTDSPRWRLLQNSEALDIPEENPMFDKTRDARFFTTKDLATSSRSSTEPDGSALSQFCDYSFSIHERSEISAQSLQIEDSMKESGSWADSTGTSIATFEGEEPAEFRLQIHGDITDLQDIPSVTYLNSIVPQTMTVNLIVGVITIRPPRRIVTRQWKTELDLVEVVVGDDTKTGFGVTFWLPSKDHSVTQGHTNDAQELRQTLGTLRPRDIVLLRMIGLSTFRERVYGQSLKKGITKIDLLHRQRVDVTDPGGIYSARSLRSMDRDSAAKNDDPLLLTKVKKVREWNQKFVDITTDPAGGDVRKATKRGPILPPDTQEDLLRL